MSLLKKVGVFNNIPENLLPEAPKQGETFTFEMQNFYIDAQSNSRRWPENYTLKAQSEFLNPESGEVIPIALIRSADKEGNNISCHKVITSPQKYGGCYILTINTAESIDIYRFLMLSSQNGSNPNRVESEDIVYYVQDLKAKAIEKSAVRQDIKKAAAFVEKMADEDLVQIASVLDLSTSTDPDVLRDAIEEYAFAHPAKFISTVASTDKDIIDLFKRAKKAGVLRRDEATITWEEGGVVVNLTQDSDAVMVEEFTEFIKTRAAGKSIMHMVAKRLKDKEGTTSTTKPTTKK